MKRKNRKIIGAVALIAALAAGGVAFTAGQTLPATDTAGYGSVSVTDGYTVSDISNTLNAMGTEITTVQLTFSSAVSAADTVTAGFADETALDACITSTQTVYTCAVTHGSGAGNFEPTATASNFAVAVVH